MGGGNEMSERGMSGVVGANKVEEEVGWGKGELWLSLVSIDFARFNR